MKRRTGPLACAVALLPLAALAADPDSGQASAGSDLEAGEPAVAAAPQSATDHAIKTPDQLE